MEFNSNVMIKKEATEEIDDFEFKSENTEKINFPKQIIKNEKHEFEIPEIAVPNCNNILKYEEDEYKIEICKEPKMDQNLENVEEFSENMDVEEKIDISELSLQFTEYNHNKLEIQSQNVIENTRTYSSKQSLDDLLEQHEEEIKKNLEDLRTNMPIDEIPNKKQQRKNCHFCNKSFSCKRLVDDHLLKQHQTEIKNDKESFLTTKIHSCQQCSYESTFKHLLNAHINTVHTKQKPKINCEVCNKQFRTKTSLDDHMLKKHKDTSVVTSKVHTCYECCYQTTAKTNLIKHFDKVHKKQKSIRLNCEFCDKTYATKPPLDEHLMKIHGQTITSTVRYCNMCDYKSTSKFRLEYHVKAIHNKEKLKCEYCNESFTKVGLLDDHLLQQHQEKFRNNECFIHKCSFCTFTTTNKYRLDSHNAIHEGKLTKKQCIFCEKSFMQKRSLDEHVLKMHRQEIKHDVKSFITNKIHSCDLCSYETTNKPRLDDHITSAHKTIVTTD